MIFDYEHDRAKKARISVAVRPFLTLLKILKISAIITGLALLLMENSQGWLVLMVIVVPFGLENWW